MAPMPVIEDPGIGIPGMPVPAPFDMSDAAVTPGDIAIIECGFAAFPPGAGTFSIIRAMACEAALAACHFLIDWLKAEAPFWKSEETPAGERWVEARAEDDAARERWDPPLPENREKI